jgi:hypothetical protein
MEGGDLKLIAFKLGRLHMGKTKLSGNTRRRDKAVLGAYGIRGVRYHPSQNGLSECEHSAESRHLLGKHFMEPSSKGKIPLYFIWDYWQNGNMGNAQLIRWLQCKDHFACPPLLYFYRCYFTQVIPFYALYMTYIFPNLYTAHSGMLFHVFRVWCMLGLANI